MNREIYFLDHPDEHVAYRDARAHQLKAGNKGGLELALWKEELMGTIAAYSRGDDLETVKMRFLRATDAYVRAAGAGGPADAGERDTYHLLLWTISLAMVLGLDPEKMAALNAAMNLAGQDALLDCLLKVSDLGIVPTEVYLHDGPFHHLVEASRYPGETGGQHVQKYFLAYLPELEKLSWYGSHIKQLPEFFGYWAFEVAAVVKAFHLTDRLFADHIFYPRDLVHQRLFRTWMDSSEGEKDRREIESELDDEETRAALEELASYFKKHYGEGGKEIPDALNMLSKLSGKSSNELKDDPEMMQQIVSRIFQGVIKANEGLQEVLEGKDLSPEAEALIKSLKLDEIDTGGVELDEEALRKDKEAEGHEPGTIGERYAKISDQLSEALKKEQEGQLAFLEGLENLVTALGMSIAEESRNIKREVADKVSAELREQRKGRNLADFDWSSLMPKQGEDPTE